MREYLFVYGTLLSTAGHPMGRRLGGEGRRIGRATISGRLYDLGKWPGLVDCARERETVHGEVHEITDPASFGWLDAYEGIDAGPSQVNEYARVKRPVRLESGRIVTAWVYLYQWDLTDAPPVPGGRWSPAHARAVAPAEHGRAQTA